MKKLFVNFMLVAVAAMAFTACQNETDGVNVTPEQNTITMTFVADAPESRTSVAIDGDGETATYSWSEGDKVGFYYVDTNATGKKKKNSNAAVISGSTATFALNLGEDDFIEDATAYNLGAFYPGNSHAGHAEADFFNNVNVKIPAMQTLTEDTFDPAADLMMSKPFMGVELNNGDVKTLEFTRIAAIGKMKLKLEDMVEGEIIKSVKFTLAEGTHFNGPVTLDLENSTYTLGEENTSNFVNLTGGELAANADRTAIFFTCFPGEYSGAYTIEVETDKAKYSKEGQLSKALVFTAGNVLNFNATVGNRVVGDTKTYTKITDANLADYSGTYLLVYEDGKVAFDGSLGTLDVVNNKTAVEIVGNTITGAYGAYTFTIEKVDGGYSIQSASGKYIGRSATSNGLNSTDSYSVDYLNTIENLVIKGKGGNALQYYATSGQERFRYFKTTQKAIALYRQNGTGSDDNTGGETGGDDNTGGETGGDDNTGGNTGGDNTDNVLLVEQFDNTTTADSSSAITGSKFPNFSGATSKAYTSQYGGIKLGSKSDLGYITSKSLDLSSAFTVEIDACKYGSDTGNIVITVGTQTKTIQNSELKAAGTFTKYTLTFESATSSSTIKIATSAKRAYIDNVKVTKN